MEVEFTSNSDIDYIVRSCELFNLKTIGELSEVIEQEEKTFYEFVNIFTGHLKKDGKMTMADNISIFYFMHYLASKTEDPDFMHKYFTLGNRIDDEDVITQFISIYKNAVRKVNASA